MKPTTAADIVLHDPEVEASLVGAAMTWPDRVEDVASDLAAEDFYVPRCLAAWRVIVEIIAEDGKPDALVVADRMRQFSPDIDPDDLRAWLVGLVRDALPPRREHVEIVLRYAAARRLLAVANDVRAEVANGADPYSVASQFARDADLVGQGGGRSEVEAATMADLVASAEDLAVVGSELETVVLNRAIKWHAEQRVFRNGRRTVVLRYLTRWSKYPSARLPRVEVAHHDHLTFSLSQHAQQRAQFTELEKAQFGVNQGAQVHNEEPHGR
jgi:hypothetical protein